MDYLALSGRDDSHIENVRRYLSAQGLFRTQNTPPPEFTTSLSLNLGTVTPSMAGPKRPQDRVPLSGMKSHWRESLNAPLGHQGHGINPSRNSTRVEVRGKGCTLGHGDVVIAAITSCTNTSNPNVMVAAGLVAKNAHDKGLKIKPLSLIHI